MMANKYFRQKSGRPGDQHSGEQPAGAQPAGAQYIHSKDQAFDTSVFADPIAEQTRWGGLALGGSSSRAVKQVVSADRRLIKYRPTVRSLSFASLFMVSCPLLWLLLLTPWMGSGQYLSDGFSLVLGIFSVIFFLAGGWWLNSLLRAKYIDLSQRMIINGRNKVSLDRAHAIQVIPERVRVNRSTGDPGAANSYYVSYELNLVYQDATRFNLLDHADYGDIRKSADELGRLLTLPVWDKVEKDERF